MLTQAHMATNLPPRDAWTARDVVEGEAVCVIPRPPGAVVMAVVMRRELHLAA